MREYVITDNHGEVALARIQADSERDALLAFGAAAYGGCYDDYYAGSGASYAVPAPLWRKIQAETRIRRNIARVRVYRDPARLPQ